MPTLSDAQRARLLDAVERVIGGHLGTWMLPRHEKEALILHAIGRGELWLYEDEDGTEPIFLERRDLDGPDSAEDLITDGLRSFRKSPEAARRWSRRRLRLDPSWEEMAALPELLESYRPPTAYKIGERLPDGTWIECERPKPPPYWRNRLRKMSAYWRKRRRKPWAYLRTILAKRVSSRRIDALRKRDGRSKTRVLLLGDKVDSLGSEEGGEALLASTAEIQDRDAAVELSALVDLAEQCGYGLSPREHEVISRNARGDRYVQIAKDLGIAPPTARVLGMRARRKLRQAARGRT